MVGYAVTMNCGVDVADIAVLILFTCWKLWGDALKLTITLTLTLELGDPVVSELLDVDVVTL